MPLPEEEEEEEERGSVGLAGWKWRGGPGLGLVGAGSGTGWIQYTDTHTDRKTHAGSKVLMSGSTLLVLYITDITFG